VADLVTPALKDLDSQREVLAGHSLLLRAQHHYPPTVRRLIVGTAALVSKFSVRLATPVFGFLTQPNFVKLVLLLALLEASFLRLALLLTISSVPFALLALQDKQ